MTEAQPTVCPRLTGTGRTGPRLSDRGSSPVEFAVIALPMILLTFLVVQAGLIFFAQSIALGAATQGPAPPGVTSPQPQLERRGPPTSSRQPGRAWRTSRSPLSAPRPRCTLPLPAERSRCYQGSA
ncbi:TadE family protein [Micromonospora sp. M12]